nr:MAG TPA: hypothetical protein [Caudoviricetes sp.]
MSSSKTTIYEMGGKGELPADPTAWVSIPKMGDTSNEMCLVGTFRWATHKMDATYKANQAYYDKPGNERYLNFKDSLYQDEVIKASANHHNVFTMLGKQNSYNVNVKLKPWQEDLNNFLDDVYNSQAAVSNTDGMVFTISSPDTSDPYTTTFYWTGY